MNLPLRSPGVEFALDVRRGRHEVRLENSALTACAWACGRGPRRSSPTSSTSISSCIASSATAAIPRTRAHSVPAISLRASKQTSRSSSSRRRTRGSGSSSTPSTCSTPSAAVCARCCRSRRSIEGDPFAEQLAMAADQFIVLPGSRLEETVMAQAEGSEVRSVYAGYHWFGDWGRDTMISLDGLTLSTGRYREAGAILRTFSHYVKDGLLPNLFPEGERQALYHTVDATSVVLPRDLALRRNDRRSRHHRAALPGAAIDHRASPARHALQHPRRSRGRPHRRGVRRLAVDVDGREGRRLGRDAAPRQARRNSGALVQRAQMDGGVERRAGIAAGDVRGTRAACARVFQSTLLERSSAAVSRT